MRIIWVLSVVSVLLSGSLFGDEDLRLHASAMFQEPTESDEETSSLSNRHLFKASEEEPRGTVFFRGAWTLLDGDRGRESARHAAILTVRRVAVPGIRVAPGGRERSRPRDLGDRGRRRTRSAPGDGRAPGGLRPRRQLLPPEHTPVEPHVA